MVPLQQRAYISVVYLCVFLFADGITEKIQRAVDGFTETPFCLVGAKAQRTRIHDKVKLPDFVLIGVQKGGTTDCMHSITTHPRVSQPAKKELHFFDRRHEKKAMREYVTYFPSLFSHPKNATRLHRLHRGESDVTGEATPRYLVVPNAAKAMGILMPRAKLLILMRNPIDRAFSHFRMTWNRWNSRKNDGKSALASPERIFLADITREVRILGACDMLQPQQKSCPLLVDTFARCVVPHVRRATVSAGSYGFLTRGLYLLQIMRWFLFFPAKQFLFLQSEDYYEDRKVVLQRVFKFLGISAGHWAIADGDDSATKLTLRLLRGTAIRNRQTSTILDNIFFTRQLRRYLADILAPYNEALYTFFARHRILFGSW